MKEDFDKIFQDAENGAQSGKPEKVIDLFADLNAPEIQPEDSDFEYALQDEDDQVMDVMEETDGEYPEEEPAGAVTAPEADSVQESKEAPAASVASPCSASFKVPPVPASSTHVAATRLERNSKKYKRAPKAADEDKIEVRTKQASKPDEVRTKQASKPDELRPEEAEEAPAKTKSRKKGVSLTAVIVAAVVFLAVLFVVVMDTQTDEETGKTVTIAEHVASEITGKTFMGQVEERLSRDMTPISVDENSPLYEKFQTADRVNVMVLGVNGNMTDTIMVGSYDMANQQVDIISVPRDTYYYRSGYGETTAFQKINSIWRTDGVVALATAVSDLLDGMPIHYYVIVEYNDIKAVMKAIGGVEINIPFYMKYDDNTAGMELHVDIPSGLQTIDESNVIEFLRFRHTNPSYAAQGYKSYNGGDIQRIQVQQEFVKEVIRKCCKLGNIVEVVKVILTNVDSDLDIGTATKVATKILSGFSTENMESYTLPGRDYTNELSFWGVNEEETAALVEKIYGVETAPNDPEVLVVEPGSRIRFVGIPQMEDAEDAE